MAYERCKTCGEFGWLEGGHREHRCPPVWLAYEQEHGAEPSDARRIYARSPESAAEKYAQQADADSAEYYCAQGNEVTVIVWREGESHDSAGAFVVIGGFDPTYTARELAPGVD